MTDVFDPARLDAIRNRVEPTPDAREAAREIAIHFLSLNAHQSYLDRLTDRIATAIARATAASEARVRELEAFIAEVAHDDYTRETVTPANAFEYFGKANQRLVYLRDKAKALGGAR